MRRTRIKRGTDIPTDAPRNKHGQACVERECSECGETFLVQWSQRHLPRRKTCSIACAAVAKRRNHKDRRGKRNPNYRNGTRTGERDREGERRWYVALEGVTECQAPACPNPAGGVRGLALHHACYRQHVRRHKGDEWDPRNSIALCDSCHMAHHQRGRVLPLSALRDENFTFAFELMGPAAYDYLRRYYDGEDERLDALLMERAA